MNNFHSIAWQDGRVSMLDQRKLPHETIYNEYTTAAEVAGAIRDMVIRGAPAIGAAAAYGLALVPWTSQAADVATLRVELQAAAETLQKARPTAVNLFWAIDRMMIRLADPAINSVEAIKEIALAEAQAIAAEDVAINKQIGANAMPLLPARRSASYHRLDPPAKQFGRQRHCSENSHQAGRGVSLLPATAGHNGSVETQPPSGR